jgi:hypothetical protein
VSEGDVLNGAGLVAGLVGAILLSIANATIVRRASGEWGGWDDDAMKRDRAFRRAATLSKAGWASIVLAFGAQLAALFVS